MSTIQRIEALEDKVKLLIEAKQKEVHVVLPIFISRICEWNAKRYKQEYNKELTYSLLKEEVNELADSETDVDTLDALVDIVYVAIGAMWKLGLDKNQIADAIYAVCNANDTKSIVKTPSHIKTNLNKGENFVPPEKRLQEILNARQIS